MICIKFDQKINKPKILYLGLLRFLGLKNTFKNLGFAAILQPCLIVT